MTETAKELSARVISTIKKKLKYLEKVDADGELTRLSMSNIIKDFEGLLKSSVSTDKLSVEKLQEQINIAVEALTEVKNRIEYNVNNNENQVKNVKTIKTALAAIGGGDE